MKTEKTVDRRSKEKLYVQIYSIILEKIESGAWPAGTQIPPEDELCRIYDVSKATVREAVQELVREGCLTRRQGKGTFVIYSVPHLGVVMRIRLSEDLFGEEVKVSRYVMQRGIRGITDDVKRFLATDNDIYYVLSRKTVKGETFGEEIFVPYFIFPGLEIEVIANNSLYDLIEEKGTKKIFKIFQTMEIVRLQENIASILGMPEGSCGLLIGRIIISSDGTPIAYTRLVGGGEENQFQMCFERIK